MYILYYKFSKCLIKFVFKSNTSNALNLIYKYYSVMKTNKMNGQ